MGGNLAKSPLVAVMYASLIFFSAVFLPFSEGYTQAMAEYQTTLMGNLMLIAYCLVVSIIAALAFSNLEKGGFGALLPLIPGFWGLQFVVPMFQPLLAGEITGVMTQGDILKRLIQGCVCTLFMLLLSMLLYSKKKEKEPKAATPAPAPKEAKPKLKILYLVIFLIVLPIIYSILYFILGYFLAWKNDMVRAYYTGGGDNGLMHLLINMLLTNAGQAGFALLRGLLMALLSLPLLLQLPGKRVMFVVINTLMVLCGALIYIIPNPIMPDDVRMKHLIANGVILLVYGLAASFLLHTCYGEAVEKEPKEAKGKKGGKPAAARAAR